MPLHHPALTPDLIETVASEFFTELMPEVMESQRDRISKIGGVYAFTLTGEDGGEWTLDFDKGAVLSRRVASAPFHMTTSGGAFAAMLDGKLDVVQAILDEELAIDGNVSLLRNIVAALP